MKNLFRPLALVFFAMSVMSNKCEKIDSTPKLDADGLPFATQTGANTFGCLINGKPFTATKPNPNGMSGSLDGTVAYWINLSYPGLSIDVNPWEKDSPIGISINIPAFKGVGIYKEDQFSFYILSVIPNTNSYVNITKYENGILSGTFQAELIYENKKYSITHGRFDLSEKKY